MTKPVRLALGAGAGIGGNVARRFGRDGYHAVLCRRSDEEGLARLAKEIESRVAGVEAEIGPIEVAVFNPGTQIGDRRLADSSYKAFELGWRLATQAQFRLASCLCPRMVERGPGTLLVTSATAAVRGNAGQHSHAAAMGGRRMLCQTLNAELAPQGIRAQEEQRGRSPPGDA